MKYMGSKSSMLKNGLGGLILDQCSSANRFIDLFAGSAAVSWFVAERKSIPVISCDLQTYSYYLAEAIIGRTSPLNDIQRIEGERWIEKGVEYYRQKTNEHGLPNSKSFVLKNRVLSDSSRFLLVRAYGGHYYSYAQASLFRYLLSILPEDQILRKVLVASLIEAASNCAAAPGHTAQPFQPVNNGLNAINDSWMKNPMDVIQTKFDFFKNKFALSKGEAIVCNALDFTANMQEGDLVFLDPPYSAVHYSRFYHVLESFARGGINSYSGTGRYPEPKDRPKSDFSLRGKSTDSMSSLLESIASKKATAIITFPNGKCSNGLSGELIKEISKQNFRVSKELIKGKFSTLGGNNSNRPARQESEELVLLLLPK